MRHKGIITENVKDIVNLFNYNFVNIGAKYATVLSQQTHTFCPIELEQLIEQKVPPNNCFKNPLISHQFVFKYINEMKGNKSTGHDDISARFIKLTAPYITDSIVKICNSSMLPRHLENGKSYPNPQKRFEGRHLQLSPHINFTNNF